METQNGVLARFVLLAALLSAAATACNGGGLPPPNCDPESWMLEWDVEGLPDPGSPPEWVERRGVEIPFVRPESGYQTHFWLPWDLNRRQAYYLRGDEPVYVRVRFMIADTQAHRAGLLAFIDGNLVPMRYRGVEEMMPWTPLEAGLGDMIVEMAAEHFQAGLNHLTLQARYDLSAVDAREPSSPRIVESYWSFTVARDEVGPVPIFADTSGYEAGVFEPGMGTALWYGAAESGEQQVYHWYIAHPHPGGVVPVSLRVQKADSAVLTAARCPDVEVPDDTVVLRALLDGAPVVMGPHDRIVATMPAGEQRVFRFQLDLPQDGARHEYEIVELHGQGRPARIVGGDDRPPWSETAGRTLVRFEWGD